MSKAVVVSVSIIVILVLIILWLVVGSPMVNNYITKKQVETYNLIINTIVDSINKNGYVTLPVGNNQTLTLVPYTAPKQ